MACFSCPSPPQQNKQETLQYLAICCNDGHSRNVQLWSAEGNAITLISFSLCSQKSCYGILESHFCQTIMELAIVYMVIHAHACMMRDFHYTLLCFHLISVLPPLAATLIKIMPSQRSGITDGWINKI